PGGMSEQKELDEEALWELIDDNRHCVSLGVQPCLLIPYLRQARVLDELDEDEILHCLQFTNRCMKTSRMLDILRTRGRNGAIAFLESLMIHYPKLYTKISGREPSDTQSGFSGKSSALDCRTGPARPDSLRSGLVCVSSRTGPARLPEDTGTAQSSQSSQATEDTGTAQSSQATEDTGTAQSSADHQGILNTGSAAHITPHPIFSAVAKFSFSQYPSLPALPSPLPLCPQAREDILETDLEEALDGRCELMEQIHCLREEHDRLVSEHEELLEQKESLALQAQKLTLDCEMYQQKSAVMQAQLRDLQAERDQAYLARDDAQAQIAKSLSEKDALRLQVVELQDQLFTLQTQQAQRDEEREEERVRKKSRGQRGHQGGQEGPHVACLCRYASAAQDLQQQLSLAGHPGPGRPTWPGQAVPDERNRHATAWRCVYQQVSLFACEAVLLSKASVSPRYYKDCFCWQDCDEPLCSFGSQKAEPPSSESLRRREEELQHNRERWGRGCTLSDRARESLYGDKRQVQCPTINTHPRVAPFCNRMYKLYKLKSQPAHGSPSPCRIFMERMRPQALRHHSHVTTISFQGEALLSQLQVVGGNETGVFVHCVTEGSAAHSVGIRPGTQIMAVSGAQSDHSAVRFVVLGQACCLQHLPILQNKQDKHDKTEEAIQPIYLICYLLAKSSYSSLVYGIVTHPCHSFSSENLTVYTYCKMKLKSQLQVSRSTQVLTRILRTVPKETIRRITCDSASAAVGFLCRAQRLLIRAIEDLAFQHLPSRRTDRAQCSGKQKAVRIVSTGQQCRSPLWVPSSLGAEPRQHPGGSAVSFSCVNLMPYTLVTPHRPPTARPVIILPRILGQILNDRLAEVQGFQKCEPEPLPDGDYASRLQRGDVLEESENSPRRCCTVQAVDKAMAQGAHCLLPLGLDCIRRLHRVEIFPIIIFIVSSERSARRLRHKLQRQGSSEEQLLECSRCEEQLLDKLPCLYRTILPDSWSDSAALLARLRSTILEEQAKIVWVEKDLC
uniref:Caspase recruitment domain family member 14 n=1 Tax=Lepisosteus oculatus TaxID=7918 RepID=W5N8Y5_LEPOC